MSSLFSIIKKNNATFYDYSTLQTYPIKLRIVLEAVLAIVLTVLFNGVLVKFLAPVVSVQSILVGFGFSVLFFLVGSGKEKVSPSDSLEEPLRVEKLNKLSEEIFYNVSYFNLTAIACLCSALLLLLLDLPVDLASSSPAQYEKILRLVLEVALEVIASALFALHYAVAWLFFFLLFESIFTFTRTGLRVSYYFECKIELMPPSGSPD